MRNCKVPSSWTLAGSGITSINYRAEAYNCDSGSTNYKLWVEDYFGSIRDETTIVRTGVASDGTTPLAWKMAANANAAYPSNVLRSPEIVIWNDTTAVEQNGHYRVRTRYERSGGARRGNGVCVPEQRGLD